MIDLQALTFIQLNLKLIYFATSFVESFVGCDLRHGEKGCAPVMDWLLQENEDSVAFREYRKYRYP